MPRNLSQGRVVAQKISTIAGRSKDRRLGEVSTNVLSSTSLGKFQSEVYSETQNSNTKIEGSSPSGLKYAHTMNLQSSPLYDNKDSPSQPAHIRSFSKGNQEAELSKSKNNYFNYTSGSPLYTPSGISNSEVSRKFTDEFSTPITSPPHPNNSKSQINSYPTLPSQQLSELFHQSSLQSASEDKSSSPHTHTQTPAMFQDPLTPPHPHTDTDGIVDDGTGGLPGMANDEKEAYRAKCESLEVSHGMLDQKCKVMQQAVKELKRENAKLRSALEATRGKDAVMEKMKREREKMEKELGEKIAEVEKIGESYETLKNEILELARFIRSQVRPSWVVNYYNIAKLPK